MPSTAPLALPRDEDQIPQDAIRRPEMPIAMDPYVPSKYLTSTLESDAIPELAADLGTARTLRYTLKTTPDYFQIGKNYDGRLTGTIQEARVFLTTPATAACQFFLLLNGVNIATVDVASGKQNGSYALSDYAFNIHDRFSVEFVTPEFTADAADPMFFYVHFTLAGT